VNVKQEIDIVGMHCRACEKMIADELCALDGVKSVSVSMKQQKALITAKEELDIDDIAAAVERAGYKIDSGGSPLISRASRDWTTAVYGVIITALLFFIFSKLGLDPGIFLSESESSVAAVSIIMGLTAGFSTCMALIGGLVAGVSARYKKSHPNATHWRSFQPHIAFNLGRIIGFMIFGGLIGLLGSALTFSPPVLGLLTILTGLLMLVIGLQLTGLFPRLTAFSLPPKLAERLGLNKHRQADYHPVRTAFLGALTFFLPCGFTQAMQLFAVAAGSWQMGALAMGLFAVGTTPGLLLVGGMTVLIRGKKAKIILKMVGVLVAGLAFVSIGNGLNLAGFRLPDFSAVSWGSSDIPAENRLQATFLGGSSFDISELRIEKGQKYLLEIKSEANGLGCMAAVMLPGLSSARAQLLRKDQTVQIELDAKSVGRYPLLCAMGIPFELTIIVEET
jgi:sulfite exporter TauE/SafE/copper chaperone CopZ